MKRSFDIVVAAVMLLLAVPIVLPIVLVLAVTGEREVLYAQTRVGLGGKRFRLLKFATMLKDSATIGTGTVTVAGDPRVLPVGRVLRKTKLNELPQIWNVLRGDMSLVGPRPLANQDFAYYSEDAQENIVQVRPGLTGIGSIVFRDEESLLAAYDLPPIEAYRTHVAPFKGRLECWYIENRSFRLDIKLLLLTVVAVVLPGSRPYETWIPDLPRRSDGQASA